MLLNAKNKERGGNEHRVKKDMFFVATDGEDKTNT